MPLHIVHGIGGEVLGFEPLARHLSSDQPLFGFEASLGRKDGTSGVVEPGDTVENSGAGDTGAVAGKIFGYDAFATVQEAVNAVAASASPGRSRPTQVIPWSSDCRKPQTRLPPPN